MDRSKLTHGFWAIVTIATFVAGSQWARPSASAGSGREPVLTKASAGKNGTIAGTVAGGVDKSGAALTAVIANGGSRDDAGEFLARVNPALARLLAETGGRPLSAEEIEALMVAATKSGTAIERRKAFDRILEEIAADHFTAEQAIAIRDQMVANRASGKMWYLFDYAWGASRPEDAIAHLGEVPERYRNGFLGNVIAGMASTSPQDAIDYVSKMESGSREFITRRLIEGLADHDPALATDYVMGLAESGDPKAREYMRQLAKEVVGSVGFEASVEWAERLPEGPLLGHALMPIANEFAKRDPTGAAEWAESFSNTRGAERVFGEVVREWGDWRQASAWVDSLPAGQPQLDGISAVWGFRGSQEPQVAVQEIIGMPQSREKDYAINGFISGLAHRDGEAATIWAAEITEPHMRTSAIIRAGKQFYRQDPDAAREWFAGAGGLPEDAWARVTGGKK